MAHKQGSTDMEMNDADSPPMGRLPTWSLAHLVEKLKKLVEIPK